MRTAIGSLKEQPAPPLVVAGLDLTGALPAAMTADVDHGRTELAQLAEQVERLHRPPRRELEAIPVARALQLLLNRARLAIASEELARYAAADAQGE